MKTSITTTDPLEALSLGLGDDAVSNPAHNTEVDSFEQIAARRLSRRSFVKSAVAISVGAAGLGACAPKSLELSTVSLKAQTKGPVFDFAEIEHGFSYDHLCAPDHDVKVLLKWGDPLFPNAPEFDFQNQTVETQLQQFGFNCDYVGFLKLKAKPGESDRALLCVNHEYPHPTYMFPDFAPGLDDLTKELVEIEQASMGNSIVEVFAKDGEWYVDKTSEKNRRINALNTPIRIGGPVAGHPGVRTSADPAGTRVIGTVNNCAGGMTPWGTYLTCEENFNFHFGGELSADHPNTRNYARYNVPQPYMGWERFDERFDLSKEPNEANRFGWVVEIDPLDPTSTPVKRTAMGRFKHEGGENILAKDGRLVVYMGDDQVFEYLYKFVSRDAVDMDNRANNANLLDSGTLYVARFLEEGELQWLPLTVDNPVLATEFASQADLLIETRRAAELLGATPMDRPEDVVPNPQTGQVFVMLTNNSQRKEPNVANDRVTNLFGHIIEIIETDKDAASETAYWDVVVRCGDPDQAEVLANWNEATSENGWFASPDNAAIDPSGRLWIATDQGGKVQLSGTADGLWALETSGEGRGIGRMFYRVPKGAELTGPCFSDDGEALFMAVQHPGDYVKTPEEIAQKGVIDWPEFKVDQPAKPSVVVVTKKGGGLVG